MTELQPLVPKLRFQGFTDAWEQRKFGDLNSAVPSNTLSRADLNYASGFIKNIHYGDLLTKFGAVLDANDERLPFITAAQSTDLLAQHLKDGDVAFADAAEDVVVGKATEIRGIDLTPVVAGLHTIVARPTIKFGDSFLGYYLNSPTFRARLLPLMQGVKVLSLSRNNLNMTAANYPNSTDEQTKIGRLLRLLDEIIALRKRKLDLLRITKTALLQRLFPTEYSNAPLLRFVGYTTPWEQRKLGDLIAAVPSNTLARADLNYESGYIKNVHYGDVLTKFGAVLDANDERIPFITEAQSTDLLAQHLKDGDVVFADAAEDAAVGKAIEIRGINLIPVVAGLHTIVARPTIQFGDSFLGYYLNSPTFRSRLLPLMQGVKVLSLSRTNLNVTVANYPYSTDEQVKIGGLLRSLDTIIAMENQKLERLGELKNSLLRQMFV
jgi:type I restriction enzyme S subunit